MGPFALLLTTAAPATTGYDTGELVTGALSLGIPHPPGEPSWVLLGRIAACLPLGSVPFRLTLLSAGLTAGATWLTARVIRDVVARALPDAPAGRLMTELPGLVGLVTLCLCGPVWLQGVRVEVYALQLCALALLGALATSPRLSPGRRWGLAGLIVGVGLGNHHALLIAALPGLGLLALLHGWPAARELSRAAGLGLLGLGSYLALPIRAQAGAALSFGQPDQWAAFRDVVTGAIYRRSFSGLTLDGLLSNIRAHLVLAMETFGIPTLALAALGLGVITLRSRLLALALALIFLGTGATTTLQGLFDADNPDALGYLCGAAWVVAVMAAVGAGQALASISRVATGGALPAIAAAGMGMVALIPAARALPMVDMREARHADRYGALLLDSLPQGAILLTSTDGTNIASWYHQAVLGRRPDVTLLAQHLKGRTARAYRSPSGPTDAAGFMERLVAGGAAAVRVEAGDRPLSMSASELEGAFRPQLRPGPWAFRLPWPGAGPTPVASELDETLSEASRHALPEERPACEADPQLQWLYKHQLEAVADALLEAGALEDAYRTYVVATRMGAAKDDMVRYKTYHAWRAVRSTRQTAREADPIPAALAQVEKGRPEQAEPRLSDLGPADGLWALGRMAWLRGDPHAAVRAWQEALTEAPSHPQALADLARFAPPDQAVAAVETALGGPPQTPEQAVIAARGLSRLGQPQAALAASAPWEEDPDVACERALSLEMTGDLRASLAAAERCLAEKPWDPEGGRLLARLKMQGLVAEVTASAPELPPPTEP